MLALLCGDVDSPPTSPANSDFDEVSQRSARQYPKLVHFAKKSLREFIDARTKRLVAFDELRAVCTTSVHNTGFGWVPQGSSELHAKLGRTILYEDALKSLLQPIVENEKAFDDVLGEGSVVDSQLGSMSANELAELLELSAEAKVCAARTARLQDAFNLFREPFSSQLLTHSHILTLSLSL